MTNGISIDFTRDKDGFANSISVTNHTAQKASTTCLGKAKASVPDTLPAVREALIDLGVAPHTLMRFIEMAEAGEITPQQAYINTIEREEKAQEFYVEQSLKPWADRHGLTLKQAVSIAFNDHEFNPETKKDDLPSYRGLFWASGAQNSFLLRLQKDLQDSPEVSAERATELLHRNYRASKAEDVAQSLYKATHALPPCNLADLVMDALTEIHMLRAKLSAAILEKSNA